MELGEQAKSGFVQGEILYDKKFIYPGNPIPCDKLLLVLNKLYVEGDDIIVIPASTETKDYPFQHGFNEIEGVFFIERKIGFYQPKTIIQLNVIQSIRCSKIEKKIKLGEMERLNKSISGEEFAQIFASLRRRSEDISKYTKDRIF